VSTPMHDTHQMIPVDENGDGPCRPEDTRAFRCWCGTDCGTVEHVRTPSGFPVCSTPCFEVDDLAVMAARTHPVPGFCPDCHAYAQALMHGLTEGES
jgi:hypothetical protein